MSESLRPPVVVAAGAVRLRARAPSRGLDAVPVQEAGRRRAVCGSAHFLLTAGLSERPVPCARLSGYSVL